MSNSFYLSKKISITDIYNTNTILKHHSNVIREPGLVLIHGGLDLTIFIACVLVKNEVVELLY